MQHQQLDLWCGNQLAKWCNMPKSNTTWSCNLCGGNYATQDAAQLCEDKGVPPHLPRGTIFTLPPDTIVKKRKAKPGEIRLFGVQVCLIPQVHRATVRVIEYDYVTGVDDVNVYYHMFGYDSKTPFLPADTSSVGFRKMVDQLKGLSIAPLVWNDGRALPFSG